MRRQLTSPYRASASCVLLHPPGVGLLTRARIECAKPADRWMDLMPWSGRRSAPAAVARVLAFCDTSKDTRHSFDASSQRL